MSDHTPFLATIARNPENMAARLVYADWLEERGDPRAEYLRLAIDLAGHRLTVADEQKSCIMTSIREHDDWVELRECCAALLAEHRAAWTMAGLPESWSWCRGCHLSEQKPHVATTDGSNSGIVEADFARGMPEILTCRFEEWQRHYETLRDAIPVREVRLTTPVDTEIGPPWKMRIPGGKWHEIKYHGSLGEDEDIQARTSSLLAAEFAGHDAARPIRYALPQADGERFPSRAETPVGGIP